MAQLELKQASIELDNSLKIMDQLSLSVAPGDFITILGGNGAGKSTLFNAITGNLRLTEGIIELNKTNITQLSEEKRATYIARVFQDPKNGTAPRMTVAENLALAMKRGEKRKIFKRREIKSNRDYFHDLCASIGNGLENHLDTPTGNLSGGQRQALSLLMATMKDPDLLLLDEHTAALDPKTAKQLMSLTQKFVTKKNLTCLMITHHMEDALNFGNRLIVLEKGCIKKDFNQEEKAKLQLEDLLRFF
ncbi:ATP-binding cassette domain-containing protein [Vagococcus silagei]|uniref:ATP-binding cassette domain-containing protein n=2 Tax=Vagococcus silagei TaxID=2508885 RepID=A0A4S3B329_9ENTE|nr:ATP-binding cassette domain-containing protein [Vagococcus silagei]